VPVSYSTGLTNRLLANLVGLLANSRAGQLVDWSPTVINKWAACRFDCVTFCVYYPIHIYGNKIYFYCQINVVLDRWQINRRSRPNETSYPFNGWYLVTSLPRNCQSLLAIGFLANSHSDFALWVGQHNTQRLHPTQ